jgi:hypothetical protein
MYPLRKREYTHVILCVLYSNGRLAIAFPAPLAARRAIVVAGSIGTDLTARSQLLH